VYENLLRDRFVRLLQSRCTPSRPSDCTSFRTATPDCVPPSNAPSTCGLLKHSRCEQPMSMLTLSPEREPHAKTRLAIISQ